MNTVIAELKNVVTLREDNSSDMYIIRELESCYGALKFDGRNVLDIGGHIGLFANYALLRGAKKVFSYEPEPNNFSYLVKNSRNKSIYPTGAAVTGCNEKTLDFYVNKYKNKGLHSLYVTRGRDKIVVNAVNFYDILAKNNPSVLKIDIEGGEYYLFNYNKTIPKYITQIAIELHLTKKHWREKEAPKLYQYFLDNGFKDVKGKKPKIAGKNWATTWVGSRY